MADRDIKELVEKSASTDLQVLLTTKENAKRAVLEDPSAGNIAAFERASKMLESAMGAQDSLKNWSAVLAYVQDAGRKLGQTKFFEDVKRGRLKKQVDGSFRRRDVDRYMASLPMRETPDGVVARAAERQRKKEEAEIRKLRADADLRELELSVRRGKFIARDDVYQELAARALVLSSGIRTAFEAHALELVDAVVDAGPEIISHNMETVRRVSPSVRSAARYEVSLSVLRRVAERGVVAKTGIMVGLGETEAEVLELMDDTRAVGVSVLTIGQYLRPSRKNIPVVEYVTPERFEAYKRMALAKGFRHVESAPLVRSSYHAEKHV